MMVENWNQTDHNLNITTHEAAYVPFACVDTVHAISKSKAIANPLKTYGANLFVHNTSLPVVHLKHAPSHAGGKEGHMRDDPIIPRSRCYERVTDVVLRKYVT